MNLFVIGFGYYGWFLGQFGSFWVEHLLIMSIPQVSKMLLYSDIVSTIVSGLWKWKIYFIKFSFDIIDMAT